jgi:hypothetical protein
MILFHLWKVYVLIRYIETQNREWLVRWKRVLARTRTLIQESQNGAKQDYWKRRDQQLVTPIRDAKSIEGRPE